MNKDFLDDSIYVRTIEKIKSLGGKAVIFSPIKINFDGFGNLLSADMKHDLPLYLDKFMNDEIHIRTMEDIVSFNKNDSLIRIQYGQARFANASKIEINDQDLKELSNRLHNEGVRYFEVPMVQHKLDVILSINNRNAGFAAAAKYPCLTVPMGYKKNGKPAGLTIIARKFEEHKLLKIGYVFENQTNLRKLPTDYN